MTVVALIPAAGFGTRLASAGPKALVRLAGRPLVRHVLDRLAASGRVERAVLAVPEGTEPAFRRALRGAPMPVSVVPGGVTRRDSVRSALSASGAADEDLLCVHDAARPLVEPDEVAAVVDAAAETGAAVAAFVMVDTVKRVASGRVVETVPRGELVAATTPQVIRADLFRRAFEAAGDRDVTDDVELVERAGGAVRVVLTSRWNLKVTYPEDLAAAEAFLRGRRKAAGAPPPPSP
ncbi:MAG: 2-C-methyl-D-erythritol 4-phosphate cytidylyltransferase [Acidobacteria bacterium]|nr:MAG: 2-C-methyl-D-erythritol 4-phosphate cytidylyltransferase [Acidobacteriota bacterium]